MLENCLLVLHIGLPTTVTQLSSRSHSTLTTVVFQPTLIQNNLFDFDRVFFTAPHLFNLFVIVLDSFLLHFDAN